MHGSIATAVVDADGDKTELGSAILKDSFPKSVSMKTIFHVLTVDIHVGSQDLTVKNEQ